MVEAREEQRRESGLSRDASDKMLRIGAGASFADDRIAPAVDLAERGELDYLVFECLAERTIARENLTRMKDPEKGYTPRLLDRMGAVLPACLRNGMRIVSNMGAANPPAAARLVKQHAQENGLGDVSCAVVRGDDVAEIVRKQPELADHGDAASRSNRFCRAWLPPTRISAPTSSARALDTGAQVVITGRVADPSLFLGPAMHHYRLALRRLDAPRVRHRRGPPARVLRASERRLLRRSRARRTCPTSRGSAFPYADVGRRRPVLDQQARRRRRPRRPRHLQGAAALRVARSRGVHHPGLRARHHRPRAHAGRARSRVVPGREGAGRARRRTR